MLIFGTGGFASDLLSSMEFDTKQRELVFFADLDASSKSYIIENYRVLPNFKSVENYFKNEDPEFIVAIGDNFERERMTKKLETLGGKNINYISESSFVSKHVKIASKGVIILHNAVVANDSELGEGSIVYIGCNLGHDIILSEYVLISGHVCMANVQIGSYTQISIGALIKPGVRIGNQVIVGIGAVVNKDIESQKTVVGNPAKAIKTS